VTPLPEVAPLLSRLESSRLPVTADCQLVHGDLSGNVLFADGLPPAIIDFSPYWRPAAYADAIIAVDGLLWFDAAPELLRFAQSSPDFPQFLLRALIFRLVAMNERARDTVVDLGDELASFDWAASAVEALLR
jgi:prepilin-type processing-associated H-X9-DG protein